MQRSKDRSDPSIFSAVPFIWDTQFKGVSPSEMGLRLRDQLSMPVVTTRRKVYKATKEDCVQSLYDQGLRKERGEDMATTKKRVDEISEAVFANEEFRERHPGVPLSVLWSAQLNTADGFVGDSNQDPIDVTATSDDFYEKGSDVMGRGDGTVNTFGAIVRPLKWSHQYST